MSRPPAPRKWHAAAGAARRERAADAPPRILERRSRRRAAMPAARSNRRIPSTCTSCASACAATARRCDCSAASCAREQRKRLARRARASDAAARRGARLGRLHRTPGGVAGAATRCVLRARRRRDAARGCSSARSLAALEPTRRAWKAQARCRSHALRARGVAEAAAQSRRSGCERHRLARCRRASPPAHRRKAPALRDRLSRRRTTRRRWKRLQDSLGGSTISPSRGGCSRGLSRSPASVRKLRAPTIAGYSPPPAGRSRARGGILTRRARRTAAADRRSPARAAPRRPRTAAGLSPTRCSRGLREDAAHEVQPVAAGAERERRLVAVLGAAGCCIDGVGNVGRIGDDQVEAAGQRLEQIGAHQADARVPVPTLRARHGERAAEMSEAIDPRAREGARGEDGEAARAGAQVEHALRRRQVLQQERDVRARNDDALGRRRSARRRARLRSAGRRPGCACWIRFSTSDSILAALRLLTVSSEIVRRKASAAPAGPGRRPRRARCRCRGRSAAAPP